MKRASDFAQLVVKYLLILQNFDCYSNIDKSNNYRMDIQNVTAVPKANIYFDGKVSPLWKLHTSFIIIESSGYISHPIVKRWL